MIYKLHRVAPNSEGWVRPSHGRQGHNGVGSYVRQHGFGHEDWNFNRSFAVDGRMLGYTVARPAAGNVGKEFGVVLATYDAGGWRAVGYYDGAEFIDDCGPFNSSIVEAMAADVYLLANKKQVANEYRKMSLPKITRSIGKELNHYCWSVAEERVHVFRDAVPIPQSVFAPGIQRMKVSYDLSAKAFASITKRGFAVHEEKDFGVVEGKQKLRIHKSYERNAKLVAKFKASLTSLKCSVCEFDFGDTYGDHGAGFIECHHTKPVSKMKPEDKTKLSDLAAVCSNCHRMLHRSSPMLTIKELRAFLK